MISLCCLLAALLGVCFITLIRQAETRAWRRSLIAYRIRYPAGLPPETVAAWLTTLAAQTRSSRAALLPNPPVVLEIDASVRDIRHYLLVPYRLRTAVLASIRAALPGARLEEAPDYRSAELADSAAAKSDVADADAGDDYPGRGHDRSDSANDRTAHSHDCGRGHGSRDDYHAASRDCHRRQRRPSPGTATASLGLSSFDHPLATDQAELTSAALLSVLYPLHGDERVRVSWIINGVRTPEPPRAGGHGVDLGHGGLHHVGSLLDTLVTGRGTPHRRSRNTSVEAGAALRVRRTKYDSPLIRAVAQVSVTASRADRRQAILNRIFSAWRTAETPGVTIRRRFDRGLLWGWLPGLWSGAWFSAGGLADHPHRLTNRLRLPWFSWPLLLNVHEAVGLLGIPLGSAVLPGLRLGSARQLPPSPAMPGAGLIHADSATSRDADANPGTDGATNTGSRIEGVTAVATLITTGQAQPDAGTERHMSGANRPGTASGIRSVAEAPDPKKLGSPEPPGRGRLRSGTGNRTSPHPGDRVRSSAAESSSESGAHRSSTTAATPIIIAESNYPGTRRPLALHTRDRLQHTWIIGPTGVGKSTLLANLILQDLAADRGLVAIDPKGDLVGDVLARVPEERAGKVVVLDLAAIDQPVGINLLRHTGSEHSRELAVDHVVHIMASLWHSSWGPRTSDVLRSALLTLTHTSAPDGSAFTLAEVPELLTNARFRQAVLAQSGVPASVRPFWQEYDQRSDSDRLHVVGPALNKLRAFSQRTALRLTLGQSRGFELDEVFQEGAALVVNLAKGTLGTETAQLFGSLLVAHLWQGILGRVAVPAERRQPVFVYLDEFQDVVRLPLDLGDMLAQARGLGVGLVLAHQYLDQLSEAVRTAVLGTARTQIAFQLNSYEDARVLARPFAPLTPDDLLGIEAYEIAMRPAVQGRTLGVVTGRAAPLPAAVCDGAALAAASRERYGMAREAAEAAMAARVALGQNENGRDVRRVPIGRERREGRS